MSDAGETAPVRPAQAHHQNWGAERLWRELDAIQPGVAVEIVAQADSTNTLLLDRWRDRLDPTRTPSNWPARRSGDRQPCLVVAERQTHGRGRQGRVWAASPTASLTFSLAVPMARQDLSGLSLAVGAALADALDPPREDAAPLIGLKWPNDLWLHDAKAAGGGRKLGGILIETTPVGAMRLAVIGVGLNIAPLEVEGASPMPASMQELDVLATPPSTLALVAPALWQCVTRFESTGLAPYLAACRRRDLLAGRELTLSSETAVVTGEGIDDEGRLCVRHADGTVEAILAGEVSVRPRDGEGA